MLPPPKRTIKFDLSSSKPLGLESLVVVVAAAGVVVAVVVLVVSVFDEGAQKEQNSSEGREQPVDAIHHHRCQVRSGPARFRLNVRRKTSY